MGNGVPLYEAAKRKILKRLETREWLPGAKLPPEGELSRELGVSVGTLRHAVGELCDEGILWRRPRRTQPVSKCNSPVNPGCSILRGQSTLAHSPPSPSQFFTPIANVGANSFKQRSTDRARFRFFDACSCS